MSKPTTQGLRCVRCGYPLPANLAAEAECPVCGSRFGEGQAPVMARLKGSWKVPALYGSLGGVFLVLFLCIVSAIAGGGSAPITPTPEQRAQAVAVQQPSDTGVPPANSTPAPTATETPTMVVPNATSVPSATATKRPTEAPATGIPTATNVPPTVMVAPTETAKPTDTPQPTNTAKPAPTATWEPATEKSLFVSAGGQGVYIRSAPDPSAKVKVWPHGTEMSVLGKNGDWYFLQAPDGYQGFMQAEYLAATRPEDLTRSKVVEVATESTGACNCTRDLDCKDFSTHAQAQACFEYCRDTVGGDPHGLDRDSDGVVCESLR